MTVPVTTGGGSAGMIGTVGGEDALVHDVSIRIAAGVGRWRGSHPRAKTLMMSIRPPQHGQGRG
ncbi:MAG: hypothetical protein C0511_06130 [Hyphomicrobium sp.]|nr:hypothetical protein [Hyphomicrobium sp.]